ncbi:MAG: 3-dehydroquinate synthase [Arenimonas sp.]
MRQISVQLAKRSYPIRIGNDVLDDTAALASLVMGKQALIVTDENIAPLYLSTIQNALQNKTIRTLILPPGEQEKNLTRFAEVMHVLADMKASRDVTLIALGGGVIGDLTGFAAACWMRGVRFVQIPTTLLAMVDSSVGGKTAVDLESGKNLVGAFHQPVAVLADLKTLKTLPERELKAGIAEVIKYGAAFDSGFFSWLEKHIEELLTLDETALIEAISRSCRQKAGVVSRDETEQGERMLLNLGHTFAHAIETEQGYGGCLHGEAVAIGMCLAAKLSAQLKRAPASDTERVINLLKRAGLPTALPDELDSEALLVRMKLDKKALSGNLRLILWRGLGRADVVVDVPETAILRVLSS